MNEVVVLSGAEQQVFGLYRRLEDNAQGLGDAFYSIQGPRIIISAVMDVRQHPETIRHYLNSL